MADQLVQYSADRGIARIALDSPDNRNALSAALVEQLTLALTDAAGDDSVRAVELTHTGSTFCAGADLSEASQGGMQAGAARVLTLLKHIVTLRKPVVGSIDGHARAGGLGLVGACDIVLAGPKSTFAFTEVRLGLAPAMISLTTLPRMDPRAATTDTVAPLQPSSARQLTADSSSRDRVAQPRSCCGSRPVPPGGRRAAD
jgi:enoyl-CoA hydratase